MIRTFICIAGATGRAGRAEGMRSRKTDAQTEWNSWEMGQEMEDCGFIK